MMARQVKVADRLSDLPDAVIHYIYSFLDMRLIVQTSTLATRWRNLWASNPNLHFSFIYTLSYSCQKERIRFMKFVNQVLMRRDASGVHKFGLSSESALEVDCLHTWIIGVLKQNVKEFHLLLGADQPFELPRRVFTSEITVLTLTCCWGIDKMKLPNAICSAPKLRSLKLKYFKLPDGEFDGELILRCPVLESLSMVWCDDSHLKVFTISAVILETLEFTHEPAHYSSCVMNICCPDLTSISYSCYGNPNLSSMNLPALVTAYINICRYETLKKEGYKDLLITILRGIHNVHSLKLGAYTLWDMANYASIFQVLPNLFTNLRGITVEDSFYDDGMTSIYAMASILEIFPWIQTLVWDRTGFEREEDRDSDDEGEDLQDPGILYGLETVEIRNPFGMKDELKFMKLLLEGAISLKKLSVKVTNYQQYSRRFRKELLAFPRASTRALVHCPWDVEALTKE